LYSTIIYITPIYFIIVYYYYLKFKGIFVVYEGMIKRLLTVRNKKIPKTKQKIILEYILYNTTL
jgi:hypothetical protein